MEFDVVTVELVQLRKPAEDFSYRHVAVNLIQLGDRLPVLRPKIVVALEAGGDWA